MDKAILKKFAIESRHDLMEKMESKIKSFYIDEDFSKSQNGDVYVLSNEKHTLNLTKDEFNKRETLIKRVKELGIEQVIEESAYTWFNRIVAIRYMEINDYLPLTKNNQSLGIRVLSSKDNTSDPEILKFTNLTNHELDIDLKKEKYIELKNENEKFKYILLLICKKLGKVIPQVFDGTTDYIDILIPNNLLNDTGFVNKIIKEVPEDNYNQVEILGWLYQYYNQTEKDRAMSEKRIYKKNEIAYVTQLFTPDWIVKYMVENSLGKLWIQNGGNRNLIKSWKYYIKDDFNDTEQKTISPENIKCIDPCCGSGHVLIYLFEVLFKIYESYGYNKNDIAEKILKNNIFGLDIDDRAGQLSILSVILKAREYDKDILNKNISKDLNILSIQDSSDITDLIQSSNYSEESISELNYLNETFRYAKEIGSLQIIENTKFDKLYQEINEDMSIFGIEIKQKILPLIKQAKILSNKYDIIVTNPPYMNSGLMPINLKKYVSKNYYDSRADLCVAFMDVRFVKENTRIAMINQNSWMFLSSFEQMRKKLIMNDSIESMIHLGTKAFKEISGEVVQTTMFTIIKGVTNKVGKYINLTDIKDSDKKDIIAKEKITNDEYIELKLNEFEKMPGNVFAYWASPKVYEIFKNNYSLMNFIDARQGMATGDNAKFVRFWYEVEYNEIKFGCKNIDDFIKYGKKYVPYIKSDGICKWYGNYTNVLKFDEKNIKLLSNSGNHLPSKQYYFKNNFNWPLISTDKFGARISECGGIFDVGAHAVFSDNDHLLKEVGGYLNSKVFNYLIKFIGLTLNYNSGIVQLIPYKVPSDDVINLVNENINISKKDWDSDEISWDFIKHPLLMPYSKVSTIRDSLANYYTNVVNKNFSQLKHNEEELNKIFINIYGLQDELKPEEEDKDVTIRRVDKVRDIKSFISYAVGCMFGRYSLDKEGLIYAGGDFDSIYKKFKEADGGWAGASLSNYKILNDNGNEIKLSFEVDNDNIIPITDDAYFADDIVDRFKKFVEVVYGKETLNENLDFIAETLGKKGTETSEETIRRYFLNDFYSDHIKTYQKRPIYWLFDSGKKNGFKALIYMHRYNENTIPKVRLDYLHRIQTTYDKLLSDVNYRLTTDLSINDKKQAQNRQADLIAKLDEIKEYDEKIAHIANQRISIDLDDGVKINYEKFKDILAKIK